MREVVGASEFWSRSLCLVDEDVGVEEHRSQLTAGRGKRFGEKCHNQRSMIESSAEVQWVSGHQGRRSPEARHSSVLETYGEGVHQNGSKSVEEDGEVKFEDFTSEDVELSKAATT